MKKTIGKFLMLTAIAGGLSGAISSGFAMEDLPKTEKFATLGATSVTELGVGIETYGSLFFNPKFVTLEVLEGSSWVNKGTVTEIKLFNEISAENEGKEEGQIKRRLVDHPTTIIDILLAKQNYSAVTKLIQDADFGSSFSSLMNDYNEILNKIKNDGVSLQDATPVFNAMSSLLEGNEVDEAALNEALKEYAENHPASVEDYFHDFMDEVDAKTNEIVNLKKHEIDLLTQKESIEKTNALVLKDLKTIADFLATEYKKHFNDSANKMINSKIAEKDQRISQLEAALSEKSKAPVITEAPKPAFQYVRGGATGNNRASSQERNRESGSSSNKPVTTGSTFIYNRGGTTTSTVNPPKKEEEKKVTTGSTFVYSRGGTNTPTVNPPKKIEEKPANTYTYTRK